MSQPLFDKPMNELREAFVRQRFAEPAVFGHADIEGWLHQSTHSVDDPSNSTSEWGAMGFLMHLKRDLGDAGTRTYSDWIRDNATALQEPPDTFLVGLPYARPFYALMEVLQHGGCEIYYGWSRKTTSWPVVIIDHHAYVAEFKGPNHILALRPATIPDVMRIFFAEVMDNRPKRQRTLVWLQNEYTHAIANARYSAQRDFEEAVAVSADGTRIVKAGWVFVIEKDYKMGKLFHASAFHENKILISSTHNRRTVGWGQGTDRDNYLSRFLTEAPNYTGGATFLITDPDERIKGFGRVYVVDTNIDPQRLPSPLPEGGREIRV
jgi:hypothetical protein